MIEGRLMEKCESQLDYWMERRGRCVDLSSQYGEGDFFNISLF